MYFLRRGGSGQFYLPDNGLILGPGDQTERNSAPTRGSFLNSDLLPRGYPVSRNTFRQVQNLFVRIFQYQHPTNQQWNRLLGRDAIGSGFACDAGNFARRPTSARMSVIAMRIKKQQKLLDPVQAQKHLRISVRDES